MPQRAVGQFLKRDTLHPRSEVNYRTTPTGRKEAVSC